jgi:hypothetical protein
MDRNRIKSYAKEIFEWLAEARLAILCITILIYFGLFGFYKNPTEQSIRISGYILQLLGMIFAIRGLLKIRIFFGQPSLKILPVTWLRSFPNWEKPPFRAVMNGVSSIAGLTAHIEGVSPDNPKATLEERFEVVLRNLNDLREIQKTHSSQIEKIILNHNSFVESQKKELQKIKAEMNVRIEEAQTNDILVSLVGLIWLTFGITMSTLSNELLAIIR